MLHCHTLAHWGSSLTMQYCEMAYVFVSIVMQVFYRLWPYQKEKVDLFMRNQLQHSIRKNLPSTLQSFTFTAIDLGDQASAQDWPFAAWDIKGIIKSDSILAC